MEDPDRRLVVEQRNRFQFYLVALTFTILGLSVQTSALSQSLVANLAELLAWLSLLISGLAGLSYLEWNPTIRITMVNRDETKEKLEQYRAAAKSGEAQVLSTTTGVSSPIEDVITRKDELAKKLDAKVSSLDKKSQVKYILLKWTFVAGLVFLGIARGEKLVAQMLI